MELDVYDIETIEQLEIYIMMEDRNELQSQLFKEFDQLISYKNIKDWNKLVRICEALAITGWGEREPLEAVAEIWINGAYYTGLHNRFFERTQGEDRNWARKGNSYILFDENGDKTNYGITQFASQRNRLPKNPIRFVMSGNYQRSVQSFRESLGTLHEKLIKETRPELYGKGFSYVGIDLLFSHHDDKSPSVQYEYFHDEKDVPRELKGKKNQGDMPIYYICPRLDVGRLSTRKGELRLIVKRHFTRAFGYLELNEQKKILQEDFLTIIDILADKLKKKKLNYNTDLLKQDVNKIMTEWCEWS